jgi:hypothetical protein
MSSGAGQTLTLHWNGKAWARVPSPGLTGAPSNFLQGVAATSATNAWAVGWENVSPESELLLHWNGKKWTRAPGPSNAAGGGNMFAVTAASAANVWAAGDLGRMIHWNGKAWRKVSVPDVGWIYGLKAVSASDVWAVGSAASTSINPSAVILHWNGKRWSKSA